MLEAANAGGAAADVDDRGADFGFVLNQAGQPRGISRKGFLRDFKMGVFNNGADIAEHDLRNEPEEDVDRERFAVNVARVFDFFTVVAAVAHRQAVDEFVAVDIDFVDTFFNNFVDVVFTDWAVFVDGNRSAFDDAFYLVAGDVDNHPVDAFVGHLLCRFDCVAYRKRGLVQVSDYAVFDSFGGVITVTDDIDSFVTADFGNDAADFGGTNVQGSDCR